MAQTLEKWIKTSVEPIQKRIDKKGLSSLSNEYFFRDPPRPIFINPNYFYAPADGIIIYQKIVENFLDPIIEVKGINYSLKELMMNKEYEEPSIVIGIFMSFYDVHVNRAPYSGYIKWKDLDPIKSYNKPM